MVSLPSLFLLAAAFSALAALVAWLRRTAAREALADAAAAGIGAGVCLAAAAGFFAASGITPAPEGWASAGSWALLASPLGATLALRWRGRRSLPRAVIASALGLAGVVLWLTLAFRGPRGGWEPVALAIVVVVAAWAVAAGACLGWWSKRRGRLGDAGARGR